MTSVAKRRCAKRETGRQGSFWPQAREDYIKVSSAMGNRECLPAPGDQLLGHGGVFILHGVLNDELFFSPGVGNEMMFVFAKVQPFLKKFERRRRAPWLLRIWKRPSARARPERRGLPRF